VPSRRCVARDEDADVVPFAPGAALDDTAGAPAVAPAAAAVCAARASRVASGMVRAALDADPPGASPLPPDSDGDTAGGASRAPEAARELVRDAACVLRPVPGDALAARWTPRVAPEPSWPASRAAPALDDAIASAARGASTAALALASDEDIAWAARWTPRVAPEPSRPA
jgi:hypothetical protein